METPNTFRGNNKIIEAYHSEKLGVTLDRSPNNPFRLHRFKKKFKVPVTGKEVDDKYVIVFWDKLKQTIN